MFFILLFITSFACAINAQQHVAQHAIVSIAQQKMHLIEHGRIQKSYPISTSGYGIGDVPDSYCTPLGKHRIVCKIGAGAPLGTIFKTAINTKKIARIMTTPVPRDEQQDLITTRIIQLEGLEEQNKQSYKRGIWIHGTPYEGNIGTPCSHGCVRMRNKDMCDFYAHAQHGMIIDIVLR